MITPYYRRLLALIVFLFALVACASDKEGIDTSGGGVTSGGTAHDVDPPFLVRVSDVAARVEIIELLEARYDTEDGLRPNGDPSGHRLYQIAVARVLHDYLASAGTQLAFEVNVILDGELSGPMRLGVGDITVGDVGVIFGWFTAGSRGIGNLGDYYDPTWSLPGFAPSVHYMRETVISRRQAGDQLEALTISGWCEISAGRCENTRTGWSKTIQEFEAMMVVELAEPRVPTPVPNSWYP